MPRLAFIVFVFIGGVSSFVNLVARIFIDQYTSYQLAIILAFPIALSTAFVLNRAFVFKQRAGGTAGQFSKFLIVNLAALVQVFLVTQLCAFWLLPIVGWRWETETVAHAIGLASPLLTSYWAHKFWTFRITSETHVTS